MPGFSQGMNRQVVRLHGLPHEEKGCAMKVRKSLRSLKAKPGAQVVRRNGKVFVLNKRDPRFKARQG
jgi:large subunit ribosomal protein L36